MTTKIRTRPDPYFPDLDPRVDLLRTPPATTQDRVRHIRILGQRIAEYVRFMSATRQNGSSAEEKDRAVAEFYERLRIVEEELSTIHDGFRLA